MLRFAGTVSGAGAAVTRAYLGLGSNLGDRAAALHEAIRRLTECPGVTVVGVSPSYETEPWEREPGRGETGWYLNAAVAVDTSLSARELLRCAQAIEAALGRTRPAGAPEAGRFAPRPIDIDLLLFGDAVISAPEDLHVPHLLLHRRAFVLRPLADLAPDAVHPTLGRTVRELSDEVEDAHVVRRLPGTSGSPEEGG